MVSFIYTNLPVNAIVRLPHLQSRDRQDQKTFLAPSADKQSPNYDRVLKTLSLPININVKGIEPWQDEMVHQIYTNLYILYYIYKYIIYI